MNVLFTAFVEKDGMKFHKTVEGNERVVVQESLRGDGFNVLDLDKGKGEPVFNIAEYGNSAYLREFLNHLYNQGY
ncbi:hypothetical protein [Leptolyngbya phage Lbo-JY46]